jgi:hypothetical protein
MSRLTNLALAVYAKYKQIYPDAIFPLHVSVTLLRIYLMKSSFVKRQLTVAVQDVYELLS